MERRVRLAVGACLGLYLARAWMYAPFTSDASWVALRVAWNTLHGIGPRTDAALPASGQTDPIGLLLHLGALGTGIPALPWAKVCGAAFGAVAVVTTAHLARSAGGRGPAIVAATLVTALSPVLGAGAVSEPGLGELAALVALGSWSLLRESPEPGVFPWSALAFGLAATVQPDGFVWFLAPLLARRAGVPTGRRYWALVIAAPLAWVVLRGVAGGGLVPALHLRLDAAAQASVVRGLSYLLAGVTWNPFLAVLAIAGWVLAWRDGKRILAVPLLVGAVAVLVSGGDDVRQVRFLGPFFAPAAAWAAVGLQDRVPDRWRRAVPIVAALGVIAQIAVRQVEVRDRGPNPLLALLPPWASARTWSARDLAARASPPPPVEWHVQYALETLPEGESILVSEPGPLAYALAGHTVLDGRSTTWPAAARLWSVKLDQGEAALKHPVSKALLGDFKRASPAIVLLNCTPDRVFGPVEALLQVHPRFRSDWTFVARGPGLGPAHELCVFRRNDATPPAKEVVLQRYARMAHDAPATFRWSDRAAEIETGAAEPADGPYRVGPPKMPEAGLYEPAFTVLPGVESAPEAEAPAEAPGPDPNKAHPDDITPGEAPPGAQRSPAPPPL
jgi:hypothetical protein